MQNIRPTRNLLTAIFAFSISDVLVTVPLLTVLLPQFDLSAPMHSQAITLLLLLTASSLFVVALGYIAWWVITHHLMTADMRRAEIEAYTYYRVQQDYEWKTRLFNNAGKYNHPSIGKTVVDPHAKIVPFVPLKKHVKGNQINNA